MSEKASDRSSDSHLHTQQLHASSTLEKDTVLAQRFVVKAPLGAGSQGSVYHAYDQLLELDVAIKVVETSIADASQLNMIRNEVLIARQLQHKNIIRVHDLFEDNGLVFFTMEYIAGEPLMTRLERPISVSEYERWGQQLFDALVACNASEIKHGDIKPDNILINEDQDLLLIDFGIGQHHNEHQQLSGHESYSAPEVIYAGQSSVQSEIYSAGKILELMFAHVSDNRHLLKRRRWTNRQHQFNRWLTHKNPEKRASLQQASDFFNEQNSSPPQIKKLGLPIMLVALVFLAVWGWIAGLFSGKGKVLPDTTVQIAIAHPGDSTLLNNLVGMLEMPLKANPQLSVQSSYKTQNLINNLALNPYADGDDRKSLASVLALDAIILLSIDNIDADDFLIRASVKSMPADISVTEITGSINANSLESDLADFSTKLFTQMDRHLNQPLVEGDTQQLFAQLSELASTQQGQLNDKIKHAAPDYAGGWYLAAENAWLDGDIQTARDNLQTLFALPKSAEYWLLRGRLLQAEMSDDLIVAEQAINQLTDLYPDRADLLVKRAEINEWANNYEQAIADYQHALEQTPNDGYLWFQIARLKINAGDTRSAIENELTRALVIFRNLKNEAGEGLVLNALGVSHLRRSEFEVAKKYLVDALKIFEPKQYPNERIKSLANLANVLAFEGEFEDAKQSLEEALTLLKQTGDTLRYAHVLDTLGFFHEEQGLYQQALEYYRQGLDIRTEDSGSSEQAQSMSNVAYMHFLIGDYSLADIYWQQAKALFSKNNEQLHLLRTRLNLAQLSLAKGDHLATKRHLSKVAENLTPSQRQELMISKLIYSYINFAEGEVKAALKNMNAAKAIAEETSDVRAFNEISLWHGEVCLRIMDLDCLATQLAPLQDNILPTMIEQRAKLNWLAYSYDVEASGITTRSPEKFLLEDKLTNVPILTEMKILLDVQERSNLPLDSKIMARLDEIVRPIFYQQYMNLLYIKNNEKSRKLLREELAAHQNYWRNHLYYKAFDDDKAQQFRQTLSQDWISQLTESQAKLYRKRYLE